MDERLLQFIWQFQYFNKNSLLNSRSEEVQILHPGTYNTDQGPDFLEARIKIGATIWVGNVELHVKSSDWILHKHSSDKNYNNIILHVVWENDAVINIPFSTIELRSSVSKLLLNQYRDWMQHSLFIPCEKNIHQVKTITCEMWKQRLIIERLQYRSKVIFEYLKQSNNHWEEVFWWLLARNFGIKVNSESFEKIARTLPVNILAKHKNQIHQTEALLFGQAGLLENECRDDYPLMLAKEYRFYRTKYNLSPANVSLHFLRMRPSGFPTVRLAQLAMLIHKSSHLFSKIKEISTLKEAVTLLNVTANDYWHYHYTFDELSVYKKKNVGTQMVNSIFINTVIPVIFAYGHFRNEVEYKDKALKWLEEIPAEKNKITEGFLQLGIRNKIAFDSQALIHLKKEYCDQKKCLECSIGNSLLKNSGL
jgi:hypothetical protein